MRTSRLSALLLGAVALATVATGCKSQSPSADPGPRPLASVSASAAADLPAGEALAAAAAKTRMETVQFTISMDGLSAMSGKGQADNANVKSSISMEINVMGQKLNTETIQIGQDVWLRYQGVPNMPKQWMHIAVKDLKAGSALRKSLEDPSTADALLRSAFDVVKDGERGYKGTVDLSKSPTATPQMIAAMGDKVKAVPFTATVDEKGRMASMTIDMSVVGKTAGINSMKVEYFGYGDPVKVTAPPASDVIEAPDTLLNAM